MGPFSARRGDLDAASRVSAPDRLLAAEVFREEGQRESFVRVGIASATTPERFDRFRGWIAAGHHAGMKYLETTRETRADPTRLLSGARSIVCLAARHRRRALVAPDGATVARYASGPDYHGTLRQRATRVARAAAARLGDFRYRVCVDSTPLAERSFAAAAGLSPTASRRRSGSMSSAATSARTSAPGILRSRCERRTRPSPP